MAHLSLGPYKESVKSVQIQVPFHAVMRSWTLLRAAHMLLVLLSTVSVALLDVQLDCVLELSATYATYSDFVDEFELVLSQPENSWMMDGV